MSLNLRRLADTLAVCKLPAQDPIPQWALEAAAPSLLSITRTPDELSIVCSEAQVPSGLADVERSWGCLKVEGPLDFALTGILSSLAAPLADAQISIFAISTFDTDYLMVKQDKLDQAIQILSRKGHLIRS